MSVYKKYDDNPTMAWAEPDEASCPTLAGYTTEANNKLCLAVMKKHLEIDVMQNVYIKYLFRDIMDKFILDLTERYNETRTQN